MQATFTLPEACAILGLTYPAVNSWAREQLFPLVVASNGRGQGRERRVDIVGLVALRLVHQLRTQDYPSHYIRRIGRFFGELTAAQLTRAIANSKSRLVVCDDDDLRLVRPDATLPRGPHGASVTCAIDLKVAMDWVMRELGDRDARATSAQRKSNACP